MDEEPKMKFDMTREISICCEREEEGLSLSTSIITEQEKIGDGPTALTYGNLAAAGAAKGSIFVYAIKRYIFSNSAIIIRILLSMHGMMYSTSSRRLEHSRDSRITLSESMRSKLQKEKPVSI